jgi:hydrogenase expression/formation protein HypD
MKHLDPYRVPGRLRALAASIREMPLPDEEIVLMEVCGTHTMNIHRHGVRDLFPKNVRLISGPGCPVCVTPRSGIDAAIAYAREPHVIVATFGDMVRVPGSSSSLEKERAGGADVRIVYSPLDSLSFARDNRSKDIIFMGIGFETTSPAIAQTVLKAREEGLTNFKVLALGKLIPPAMELLVADPRLRIRGFLAAAHVTTIIGLKPYEPIAARGIAVVVAGFEPADILAGVRALLKQISEGRSAVENEYSRVARPGGNPLALETLYRVFEPVDSEWLGLGEIPQSGIRIREELSDFDAERAHPVQVEPTRTETGCRCGEVLMGLIEPPDCALFATVCTPSSPEGACMVSSEGTCAAYYKYRRFEEGRLSDD